MQQSEKLYLHVHTNTHRNTDFTFIGNQIFQSTYGGRDTHAMKNTQVGVGEKEGEGGARGREIA